MSHATDSPRDEADDPLASAFVSAHRHSLHVRQLKAALVVVVIGVCGALTVNMAIRVFGAFAPALSMSGVSINGAKITMNAPRLVGSRAKGEGYVIVAAKAEQDVTHPTGVDLTAVEGDITTADHDTLHLVAQNGHYETVREALELGGGVRLSNVRYRVNLLSAHIDFKAGVYTSDERVTVRVAPDTTIVADSFAVRDSGALVQFTGHVKTKIHASTEEIDAMDLVQTAKP